MRLGKGLGHAGHHSPARRKTRRRARRWRRTAGRGPAQERQADRARAPGDPIRRRLLRGVGHVRRAPLLGFRTCRTRNRVPGDGVVTGYGTVNGRTGLPVSARISPFSAAHCPRPMRRRSARSWTWRAGPAPRSSASTTQAARASRKAWLRSVATPKSFSATCLRRASCRRFPVIMGPVCGRRGLFAGDDRFHLHGERLPPTCSSPDPTW